MYTVDASVWVNSFDQREAGHEISRRVLEYLRDQAVPVIVPFLVLTEVAGAVSRSRNNPAQALAFAAAISNLPNVTFVPLDATVAQQASQLAAQHGLRGADAVYGAVALQASCTLITLDHEHLTRLIGIVPTRTPADALTDLTP
ncbi:MAG TPA: PIN domain-containing protein [Herpetosiphonaceae bacterium]